MKPTILLIMLLLSARLYAPAENSIFLMEAEAEKPFERLIGAVIEVESRGDSLAYNPTEQAYGIMQIRPIRLLDYNQRTGKNYQMQDCFKVAVSREIFLYYAVRIGLDFETIAKNWNGSGQMVEVYWKKVKTNLYNQ